jgi:hypothetical protein
MRPDTTGRPLHKVGIYGPKSSVYICMSALQLKMALDFWQFEHVIGECTS